MKLIRPINPLLAPPRGLDALLKYGRNPRQVPKLWAGAGDRTYAFDANMLLCDGTPTGGVNGYTKVGGADGIIDLGGNQNVTVTLPSIADVSSITPQQARIDAVLVIDATAINTGGSGVTKLILVGSNDPAFGTGSTTSLAMMEFGSVVGQEFPNAMITAQPPSGSGSRYEMLFTNEQNNVKYQYVKLYAFLLGVGNMTFKAFVAVLPEP